MEKKEKMEKSAMDSSPEGYDFMEEYTPITAQEYAERAEEACKNAAAGNAARAYDDAVRAYDLALELAPENAAYLEGRNVAIALRLLETGIYGEDLEACVADIGAILSNKNRDRSEMFEKLYFMAASAKERPLREVVKPDDVPILAALAAEKENYALLDRFFAEFPPDRNNPINIGLSPAFVSWEPTLAFYITSCKPWQKMREPRKMLVYLASHGADLNKPSADGWTPLGNQCYNGAHTVEKMEALLELGVDPNMETKKDEFGITPLVLALLPHNLDPETYNFVPLSRDKEKKAELLIRFGADVNHDCYGTAPFAEAFMYYDRQKGTPLIELFRSNGADVEIAIQSLKGMAEGFPPALYALWELYDAGEFVPRDEKKARDFLIRAADLGYKPAIAKLG